MEPFLNGTIPPSRGHRLFSPSEGERERYRRYCGLDAGGERCPHSRGRGSFALGGRRPAKGGTRHLRFLIPPLATPPDLPLAATPCGRASKMRGERRFYVCALFLFAPLTFSFVICRAYQCAAGLYRSESLRRVPDNRLSPFAPLPRTDMRGNRGRSQPQTALNRPGQLSGLNCGPRFLAAKLR